MPDQPTNLTLARMIRDLERLRVDADAAGLSMLVHLIDMAIIEAKEQAEKRNFG